MGDSDPPPPAGGPEPTQASTTRRMRAQKRTATAPEMALRRELHRRGRRFRVGYPVLPNARRRVDIAFTRQRVAVEVYGCFWHACPDHGTVPKTRTQWWTVKLARNSQRDRDNAQRLAAAGWALVVVWEHECPVKAADRVEATLLEREQ